MKANHFMGEDLMAQVARSGRLNTGGAILTSSKQFTIGLTAILSAAAAAATTRVEVPADVAEAYKARLASTMKDPGSVQFQNVRFLDISEGKNPPVMCAEVNAKNSFGGYIGFEPYAVLGDAEKTVMVPSFAAIMCKGR